MQLLGFVRIANIFNAANDLPARLASALSAEQSNRFPTMGKIDQLYTDGNKISHFF
jgi:hypothetical protein